MGKRPNAGKEGKASVLQVHVPDSHKDAGGAKAGQLVESPADVSSLKKKALQNPYAIIRRSPRIQKAMTPSSSKGLKPVIEVIDGDGSVGEDEAQAQAKRWSPEPDLFVNSSGDRIVSEINLSHKSLEERVDYLFQLVGVQEKMIEGLTNRSYQLGTKLEDALHRLNVCEKVACKFSELMEKLKDAILCSNLSGIAETNSNLSPQAIIEAPELVTGLKTPAMKRQKVVGRK